MPFVVRLFIALALIATTDAAYWLKGTCTAAERGEFHEGFVNVKDWGVWPKIIKRFENFESYDRCFTSCYITENCQSIYWEAGSLHCYLLNMKLQVLLEFANTGNFTAGSWLGGPMSISTSVDRGRKRYASCDTFCNFPDAACVQDCAEAVSCVVDESTCVEAQYYNRAHTLMNAVGANWHNPARNLQYYGFTKLYANSHLRIRAVSTQGMYNSNTGDTVQRGVYIRARIYQPQYGWRDCQGESGVMMKTVQTLLGRLNYPGWNWRTFDTGYAYEAVCMYDDVPAGTNLIHEFREDCQASCGGGYAFRYGMHGFDYVEIEELVPANRFMKLDESSECAELTSFNVQQRDFSTASTTTGNNVLLSNFYITYKKRSSKSTLRIKLQTNIYNDWANKARRYEFKVNGQRGRDICTDGNDLVASWMAYTYGEQGDYKSWRGTDHFHLDSICRGLAAGTYTFQLYAYWGIDMPPGYSPVGPNYYAGHGGESTTTIGQYNSNNIIVEEINEGVPVSASLTPEGTLKRFKSFNRRYQVHMDGVIYNNFDFTNKRPFVYTKIHDKSVLHIRYFDGYGHKMDGQHAELCKNLYITIDNQRCNSPYDLQRRYYVQLATLYYCRPEYLEGYCKGTSTHPQPDGIPAGTYTITINTNSCYNNRHVIFGSGTIGHWMVEEIFL